MKLYAVSLNAAYYSSSFFLRTLNNASRPASEAANNVTQSMSKAGCPYDNAPMERFYNTFKSNFYNITSFSNVEMMDELTMNYINWYNYVRPHSYNDYLTPMEARYR